MLNESNPVHFYRKILIHLYIEKYILLYVEFSHLINYTAEYFASTEEEREENLDIVSH